MSDILIGILLGGGIVWLIVVLCIYSAAKKLWW